MASSSSSHKQNRELNALYGLEPPGKRGKVSESSRLFDVFINHRGPDIKQTLAMQLYNSLTELGIHAFLDSEEKELGASLPSTIETAIRSASAHIAIFSKGYAHSPWCLDELVLMLRSRARIFPVFYQVKQRDLCLLYKGVYAEAFATYKEKGRYLNKIAEWTEALRYFSYLAGLEFGSSGDCETIVAAVQRELKRKRCFHVAKYPVGLRDPVKDFERHYFEELVKDFKYRCGLDGRVNRPNIVGIFGQGGVGKTTLAKELFNRNLSNYSAASFLSGVREASMRSDMPSLQLKLLKDLFNEDHCSFACTEEGASYLKDRLQRSPNLNFLIVVDDIDRAEQLNDLLIMDILNGFHNSLVIVITQEVGLLLSAGITVVHNLKGMDRNGGRELFCLHAFGQAHPFSGYEGMVDAFVDVCGGIPLSLKILGRHLYGRDDEYWVLELNKARKMQPGDLKRKMKIIVDALDNEQKQVFMDIACFFGGKLKSTAENVWEASGWKAASALEKLKDKCLVEEIKIDGMRILLRMHDYMRDLGREMADELSSPHRVWHPQDLKTLEIMGFRNILTDTNFRCYHSFNDKSMDFTVTFFLGKSDNLVETSASLLWLKLEGKSREQSHIPSWIPLQDLYYLEIDSVRLKTLWENNVQAPSRLKELVISQTSLMEFPDFSVVSDSLENGCFKSLEILDISGEYLISRISISGIHYGSLQSIILEDMESLMEVNLISVMTLIRLDIIGCKKLKTLTGTSNLRNLVLLSIIVCPDLEELKLAHPSHLQRITIYGCQNLKSVNGISSLAELVELDIIDCEALDFDHLCFSGMKYLERMKFTQVNVKNLEFDCCPNLKAIQFGCEALVQLNIRDCPNLEELKLAHWSRLQRITIDGCQNLKSVYGISSLEELVELDIIDCEALDFDHLCFSGKKYLERMKFTQVNVENLKFDCCPNLKAIQFGCEELEQLNIRDCPKLEELLFLKPPSCLKKIIIDGCDKLGCLQLDSCRNLKSMSGNFELRSLFINDCPQLEVLPNLARMSFLEQINIVSCEKLRGITLPTTLISLSVRSCRDLQRVEGTADLIKLEEFEISDCGKLEFEYLWKEKEHAPLQLRELIITGTWSTSFEGFPRSISYLNNLKKIALLGDAGKEFGIKGLPEEFCDLQSLEHLELRHCTLLSSLPARFGDLRNLRHLDVCYCKALRMLPVTFKQLEHLKHLDLSGCKRLLLQRDTLENIRQLENLYLSGCLALQKIPQVTDRACLRELHLQHTHLEELPGNIGELGKLEVLTIGSPLLRSLPDSIGNLSSLKSLTITNCFTLKYLPETLRHLVLLEHLSIEATRVRSLPQGFRELGNLRTLKISDCPLSELGFELVPSFSLEKLVEINLSETLVTRLSVPEGCCPRLETLQLSKNDNLEVIETLPATVKNIQLVECEALKNIKGILDLPGPLVLTISDCPEVEKPVKLAFLESEKGL